MEYLCVLSSFFLAFTTKECVAPDVNNNIQNVPCRLLHSGRCILISGPDEY